METQTQPETFATSPTVMAFATPSLTVNVDLDGVVYPFTEAMRDQFVFRGWKGAESWSDPKSWAFYETWPVTRTDVEEVMYAGIMDNEVFRQGRAMEGAKAGLTALRDMGYQVRIVTAKTFDNVDVTRRARISTLRWLDERDIPYDEISFTKNAKVDYLADIVIDDKPDLDSWAQPGALNLLFHQEWNKEIESLRFVAWERAKGWADVVQKARLWKDLG